jgi:hypothetical protein
MDALVQLLDYAAANPDTRIRFSRSDMILYVHGDPSYLSEPQARFKNEAPDLRETGPIHIDCESRIMKNFMTLAS